MSRILAVTEQRDGALRKVSFEIVTVARRLADRVGGTVDAITLGPGPLQGTDQLGRYGADRVLVAQHPAFTLYSPDGYATVVAGRARDYRAVLFGATATGRDLAPRVAARVGTGLASEVTEVELEPDGTLVVTRPVYAGKALQRVRLQGTPALLSLRPNTVPPAEAPRAGALESVSVPSFTERVTVQEVKAPAGAKLDVAEAPIVVSGGRGLKDPANFKLLEELADALGNAAVGASRAVVDAGWREHSAQVGQTGKTVSPSLYVAVGISGAIQHLAGMRTAKTIVAINRDKDAPIFKVADYGIVGDLFEVVPRLIQEIRRLKGEG
jgi:electron transfer flavoprotein alpha subunit